MEGRRHGRGGVGVGHAGGCGARARQRPGYVPPDSVEMVHHLTCIDISSCHHGVVVTILQNLKLVEAS